MALSALALSTLIASTVAAQGAPSTMQPPCDAKAKTAKLNFTLKNVEGEKVALSEFKGKVIILDFWATWCAPCRAEIPEFVALQEKYADRGLQIIGVSVDDSHDKLKPYVAELKMNYPVLLGKDHNDLLDAFAPIPSIPTSVVISRDGRICGRHAGIAPMDVFEREIQALF